MRAAIRPFFNVDRIFWFLLLLFTNPGGIQQALGISKIGSSFNLNDLVFLLLTLCFLSIKHFRSFNTAAPIKAKRYVIALIVYYILIFGYLTPIINESSQGILGTTIKIRHAVYCFSLFLFSFEFWLRSWKKFIKYYLYSSILILLLFLQSLITNIDILPKFVLDREFISVERNLMISYGLMPFLTAIGSVSILFISKFRYKVQIIFGFILMNVSWLVSLTRRHIIGLFIILLISLLSKNYLTSRPLLISISSLSRVILVVITLIITIYIFVPQHFEAGIIAIESSISVITTGENITGQKDERLSVFGREQIMSEFHKSPILGTGFNNLWRTSEGDQLGFEASDYPFQSALAMTGIVGILFFLPIYILLLKCIISDLNYVRAKSINIENANEIFFISLIINFIFNMLQYVNWFFPLSNGDKSSSFFILMGFYIASREIFYSQINKKNYNSSDSL